MQPGRPSDYTPDLADLICGRLADGESLRSVCRDEGMPDKTTVFRWLRLHEEFRAQYARATEERAESFADDIVEIADDGRNDWMEKTNKEGECVGWQLNGEHVMRSKLRVDSRKWLASKMFPKKYGDKVETTHKGDPAAPVALKLEGSDIHG